MDEKPNLSFEELQQEVNKRVIQNVYPVECKLIPYLIPREGGKYYVNIKLLCENDKNDGKWNRTQLSVMKWEKALINLFKVELGIEVTGVGIS